MAVLTGIALSLGKFFAEKGFAAAVDGYKAKLAAGNTTDRIAADLAARDLSLQQRERELATQTLIAEQGRWWTALPRPLFAYILVVYFGKVLIWDKVLGWGTTDAVTGFVADWCGIILTAYFVGRSAEKTASVLGSVIARILKR